MVLLLLMIILILLWVFFLHDKSEIQGVLKKFLKGAQNEFDISIKKTRSNNGNKFKNTQVEDYLDEEVIYHKRFLAKTKCS
jgi:uncharacterized protein YpmS